MITLYHCDGARSFRPLWMLEELRLPYELKMLPFPPRVFAKEYLALNPLGTYTAPAPQRPARAAKLTLRRSGKRLVLRWRGDREAFTQQVDIRSSTGLNLTRTVKRATTSIALPATRTKLVVTITGTTRSGLAGTAARFTKRVPVKKR